MRTIYRILALVLCVSITSYTLADSQGNSWDRVRYNGGTLQTKVDPKDWDNHLTVTSDLITFKLKDGQQVDIPTKSVTGLSYGQEAHRRVGTMVALGILISPLALFGLFHKTKLHFIAVEFTTSEGKGSALLLQGDKSNYRAILTALSGATGAPLSISAKDRESLPALPNLRIVKEEQKDKEGDKDDAATTASSSTPGEAGTVSVKSTPDTADVTADGNFVGNAPASLKLSPGKHTIKVSFSGYKDWSREITVNAGSEVSLNATLEKQ